MSEQQQPITPATIAAEEASGAAAPDAQTGSAQAAPSLHHRHCIASSFAALFKRVSKLAKNTGDPEMRPASCAAAS